MSNEGVIKRLRNVAILVTVVVLILLVALNPSILLYPSELVFPALIALFVSLPLYILWAIAKARLKDNQRAGVRTAYLRACLAGVLMPFLTVVFALYTLMAPQYGPTAGALSLMAVVLASPLISGMTMLAVFLLAQR